MKNQGGCSTGETPLPSRLEALFATYEAFFHYMLTSNRISRLLSRKHRQKKALTAKNIHLTGRDGGERQMKEVKTREWSEEGR